MSGVNLLSRLSGSASIHYKGQDFWTNDVAAFDIDPKPFKVNSDAFGSLSSRAGGRTITVKFTPVGVWTAAQIAVLFPWLNPRYGDFNTPVRVITAVNLGTNSMTSPGHGQITGTGVRAGVQTGGTLPTGLNPLVTYYLWASADGNTIQFYDTEAHALAADGNANIVGQIPLVTAGANGFGFIVNSPLIITTEDGLQLTVWNAAIAQMPGGQFGPLKTAMKSVTFEGYTLHGQQWSDANSIYTPAVGVIGATPPNQAQIPTVQYNIDWATRLPVTAVNDGTNILTIPNHGLVTGQAVTADVISQGGALPSALAINTTYYVIVVDANTIGLATSYANAEAGTKIPLVTDGNGTINILPVVNLEGISAREEIEVDHTVTWGDVMSQQGLDCRRIKEVETKVSFVPTNVSFTALLALLGLQGGSAGLGQQLPNANLDVYGPGENPFIRIYGATLQNSPGRFGSQADRVDKLNFISTRSFRGPTPNPISYVGVAAPSV